MNYCWELLQLYQLEHNNGNRASREYFYYYYYCHYYRVGWLYYSGHACTWGLLFVCVSTLMTIQHGLYYIL